MGGRIPRQFIPAVDKGVQDTMTEGVLAGYPVVDVKVAVYDGSYHSVDSNEMAFKTAARIGFRAAAEKADPVLLEPIATLEITVPDEYSGAVMGDISSMRGRILGMDAPDRGYPGHQGAAALRRGRPLLAAPALDHERHRHATPSRSTPTSRFPATSQKKVVEAYEKDATEGH